MIWFYDALASIRGFLELGGDVLYGIMFVLFLMWTFILERLWYFYRIHPTEKRSIVASWEARADTTSWYAKRIREEMISKTSIALKSNVGLIKALIAICPLLGLMGWHFYKVGTKEGVTYVLITKRQLRSASEVISVGQLTEYIVIELGDK